MNVVLTAVGSRGDVQPLVVMGKKLEAMGHRVKICAPPNFGPWIEDLGLDFYPVGQDMNAWIQDIAQDELSSSFQKRFLQLMAMRGFLSFLSAEVPRQVDALEAVVADDDEVVIAAGLNMAAETVASTRGLKSYYTYYVPTLIPSEHYAPIFFPVHGLPKVVNRALWWVVDKVFSRVILKYLGPLRLKRGLDVPRSFWNIMPTHGLLAFDAQLAAEEIERPEFAQSSHLESVSKVGAMAFEPGEQALEPEIQTFIDAGDAPIYCGFGSMPDLEAQDTLALLLRVHKTLGERIIYCPGDNQLDVPDLPDGVLVIRGAPHHRLFPQMKLIMHHGGAGTTLAATRAGTPQFVIPHFVDQFYWGRRVYQLGLGPKPLNRLRFSFRHLKAVLAELPTAPYAKTAKIWAEKLKAADREAGFDQFLTVGESTG